MKKKSSSKKRTSKTVKASDQRDKSLRDHLLYLLKGGGAHISFNDAIADWTLQLAGVKVANSPHTAWMLLEHMRLAQWDILDFSRNAKHVILLFTAHLVFTNEWRVAENVGTLCGWQQCVPVHSKGVAVVDVWRVAEG